MTQIRIKNNVHPTGGHPGKKIGGQSDLYLDKLDVRCIIVKWGVVFMVLPDALLKSGLEMMYTTLEVT